MPPARLSDFVRTYLERVVNSGDLAAVDEFVAPDYRGTGPGWPVDRESLHEFYASQARSRPDWRIDVQETIEVGNCIAVRAHAGGTISNDDDGKPLRQPTRRDIEWLAVYRIEEGHIKEVNFLASSERPPE